MELGQRKARFSLAYIEAVAASAGYQIIEPRVDDDSVDGMLMGREGRRPRIEFQAKASARDLLRDGTLDNTGSLAFPLQIKNYNDLRADTIVPRILIVVLLPEAQESWLSHSEEALTMRHCGYWLSLKGAAATDNAETVTVHLPRSQALDSGALAGLMSKAEQGVPL